MSVSIGSAQEHRAGTDRCSLSQSICGSDGRLADAKLNTGDPSRSVPATESTLNASISEKSSSSLSDAALSVVSTRYAADAPEASAIVTAS